jgi:hypothetical protein
LTSSSEETTSNAAAPPKSGRFAFGLLVVSTVNWIAIVGYTLVWSIVNRIIYFGAHPNGAPSHSLDGKPTDYVGLLPYPVPWWLFALGGAVMVVVAIAAFSPKNRMATTKDASSQWRVRLSQGTAPGFRAWIGVLAAILMTVAVAYYDGLTSVYDPYYLGIVLCLVAALISLASWQRDAPDAVPARLRSRPAIAFHPSRLASALGLLVAADLIATLVFGFGGIIVNQTIYLTAHGGALPPGSRHPYLAGSDIWPGFMPIDLPWWIFATLSALLLVVMVVSWPAANQYGPQLSGRVFFRRASPGGLLGIGILMILIELITEAYYGRGFGYGRPTGLWSIGPFIAILVVVVVLARSLARFFQTPFGQAFLPALLRRKSKSRKAKARKKTHG